VTVTGFRGDYRVTAGGRSGDVALAADGPARVRLG
jgi:hypothetical protein